MPRPAKISFPIHILHPEILGLWLELDCGWVSLEGLGKLRDCPLPLYLKEDSKN